MGQGIGKQWQFLLVIFLIVEVTLGNGSGLPGRHGQLHLLGKTVEMPQVQFLDKVSMPVVVASGADGQTVQKTRGDSAGAVC